MSTTEVWALEPNTIITLYILDASDLGAGVYYFHSYDSGSIFFQGIEYTPWPLEAKGFEMNAGRLPTPTLRLGNVGGFITALCLNFDDLVGSKLTIKRTLAKFLDNGESPDPNEEWPEELWFVEQKRGETRTQVEFELASALDFQGVKLPRRKIIANYCPWKYRGAECGYIGPPVADSFDIITTDASKDVCGKRLQSCKLRFGEDEPLPFGGFPAAGLIR